MKSTTVLGRLLVVPSVVAVIVSPSAGARAKEEMQERKAVPSDSVRLFVTGCAKGYTFTAGPRTEDQPGGAVVPEGTRLRMNGPKKTMADIKREEGAPIELTGLIKKGQVAQDGVGIGSGVRIGGGPSITGGLMPSPDSGRIVIDVEGWRRVPGECSPR